MLLPESATLANIGGGPLFPPLEYGYRTKGSDLSCTYHLRVSWKAWPWLQVAGSSSSSPRKLLGWQFARRVMIRRMRAQSPRRKLGVAAVRAFLSESILIRLIGAELYS